MRLAYLSARARPPLGTRYRVAALLVLATLGPATLTGCSGIADPGRGSDHARLVSELASRMAAASTLTYTATYRMPGDTLATIAQSADPPRVAYTYPGGKLVLTQAQTWDCRTGARGTTACAMNPPPSPALDPATALLLEIAGRGLAAPTMVSDLLVAAELDPDTVVTQHDTTIAGENATCVDVSGVNNAPASSFTACVITAGLLGSFTGAIGGSRVDVTLDRYQESVLPDAFDLPAGATISQPSG